MLNPGKTQTTQHRERIEAIRLKEWIKFVQPTDFPAAFNYILKFEDLCFKSRTKIKEWRPRTDSYTKVSSIPAYVRNPSFWFPLDIFCPPPLVLGPSRCSVQKPKATMPVVANWENNHWPLSVYYVHVVSFASWGFNCRLTNSSKASFIHPHWHTSLASATVICITQHKGNLEHTTSNDM